MKLIFTAVILSACLYAKDSPITIFPVTDSSQPDSQEVMNLFRKQAEAFPHIIKIVGPEEKSPQLVFQEDCIQRELAKAALVCYYTLHYSGLASKSWMGAGAISAETAAEVATAFLGAVAKDIVERMNSTMRTNAIEALETCLFLTQSSCAVPPTLASELKAKTLNLSQYLQAGGLKK